MSDQKHEIFVSTATIYKPGTGHPFAPGSPVPLHPDHAAAFRAADLEKKPIPVASKASASAPGKKD